MMNLHKLHLFAFALLILMNSCSKDDDSSDDQPTVAQGMLKVRFSFTSGTGTAQYMLSDYVDDAAGKYVQFDHVHFFVSNIRILDVNGNQQKDYPGLVLLADVDNVVDMELGLTNAMTVGRIAFDIGLDPQTDAMQPTDFSQPPLNDQTNYESGQGYKFFELTGKWDSTNNNIVQSNDDPVSYVSLSQAMVRQVDTYINTAHTSPGSTTYLKVRMDNIMNGVTCSSTAISVGSGSVNSQLMNNLQGAISKY